MSFQTRYVASTKPICWERVTQYCYTLSGGMISICQKCDQSSKVFFNQESSASKYPKDCFHMGSDFHHLVISASVHFVTMITSLVMKFHFVTSASICSGQQQKSANVRKNPESVPMPIKLSSCRLKDNLPTEHREEKSILATKHTAVASHLTELETQNTLSVAS